MANSAPPAQVQRIIRLAMLSGVLIFGAVIYYLRTSGMVENSLEVDDSSIFPLAAMGLVLMAGGSVFLFRRLIEQSSDETRRFQLSLVAYALCESAALFGGVLWLLSGVYLPFLAGVGVFVMAFAWIPGPTE